MIHAHEKQGEDEENKNDQNDSRWSSELRGFRGAIKWHWTCASHIVQLFLISQIPHKHTTRRTGWKASAK